MSRSVLLPYLRCWLSHILLPLLSLLFFLSFAVTLPSRTHPTRDIFPFDYLTPYPPGRHGSRRSIRDISNCLHTTWNNRTFETFEVSTDPPASDKVSYQLHKFADITKRPLGSKYLMGTIAYVEQPYHTFSVLEPGGKGGCSSRLYGGVRETVGETAGTRKGGCKLAANGGFFVVVSGRCLGNIVSDGRVVQTASNEQNANFGIREDGTIVVGYIPDEEVLNTTNPFRQLVTGVVWLVRNGTNYVNESKRLECADHEDTGRMDTFVKVVSARSALGHDAQGRLVMAQIEGQTHRRGTNLIEFADLLIRHGVVNAINLDGGGSNTLLKDGVLMNYPSDHCVGDGQYRCPRAVSTALCVHDVQCLDPECRGHGDCEGTKCVCHSPWTGDLCETLNCSSTDCTGHGNCSNGKCKCDDGWTGQLCSEACPRFRYGPNCSKYCWCYGNSRCHHITGHCECPPGFYGYTCIQECSEGYYGAGCKEKCTYPHCSGHGHCSKINGTCLCDEGWMGHNCNTSEESSGSMELFPFSSFSLSPSPTSTNAHLESHPNNLTSVVSGNCDCSKSCGEEQIKCSAVKDVNNTSESSVLLAEDATILQWTVAISLLISLLTLVIHTAFCFITRRWAYMAACRTQGDLLPVDIERANMSGKKKKIKRRKPRPKYRAPLMLQYSSSTDCSL